MPYLKANFDELIERMRHGRDLGHVSFEPVYYLIFPPSRILDVKRALPASTTKPRNEGWDVHPFSITAHSSSILSAAAPRKIWLSADRKAPQAWKRTNDALANALSQGALQHRLEAEAEEGQRSRRL